ncbi:MAG: adenylate/guanylate cyclase domain-containing protein [Actinomycetota bacterium]
MPELPTGTVTFLFTDIEGSTNLARTLGDRWPDVLEEHHAILREAIRDVGGIDIRTEGDAFFAVFTSAPDAIAATAAAQRALSEHPWPADGSIRVRMGLHTGEGRLAGDDYVGLDVHRAARIAAAGHGGQVLISDATKALAADKLPDNVKIRNLGEHRLKDFDDPQSIHQLVIEGLPDEFPPLKTLDVPTNLPVQLNSFIGRDRELAELESLLDEARLVSLVGPGGTGKTRLALEVAARRAPAHRDGVYFVDLSPIRDPELVPASIVQSLGLKERPDRPALQTVTEHLADRRALLLMDNFEQVVGAAAVVDEILHAAGNVSVVTTTRIRLNLVGERAFPVPPLGVPGARSDVAVLEKNEAVSLFVERARGVQPSFEITEDNANAVADICVRLDGLPLAIELAAAQARLLSPTEILARLERHLPLRAETSNIPERQRTLRAAIEWSDQLLDPADRRLFARLSVFAGGASLDAIDHVCNPDGDLRLDTLDGLASLFDQSLVRRVELAEGSRFTMLETIREYATERLAADHDREETERRHAEFFGDLAGEWGPRVRSPEALAATAVLERDYDNIRAAVAWSLRADRADIGLRVAAPMWMYWVEHGPVPDGRRAAEALLELPSAAPRDGLRAAGLEALGALSYWEADYASSEHAYGEALQLSRELGDVPSSVEALKNPSYVAGAAGDTGKALTLADEARKVATDAGLVALAAEAAGLVGLSLSREGDNEGALAATQEALEGFEA